MIFLGKTTKTHTKTSLPIIQTIHIVFTISSTYYYNIQILFFLLSTFSYLTFTYVTAIYKYSFLFKLAHKNFEFILYFL